MNLVAIACLVVILASSGHGIRCYVCTNCNEAKQLNGTQLQNCPDSLPACYKVFANGHVSRSCSIGTLNVGCKTENQIEACVCKKDACNGAGTVKSTAIFGFVISLFVAKFINII
uniref:uncharacterized protein LOC120331897 isoform X1 n=1 Tax=Styela clava TaxID=7725 RepID=UPI00193A92CE|nr:uncharacterized protein LOC120331897 isoform X1 [Styela clava]